VIITIHATKGPWSVLHQIVCKLDTSADVMSITQVATVNNLSIKHAPRHGGDLLSVDLVIARRIADLIQVVTSRQESAVVG